MNDTIYIININIKWMNALSVSQFEGGGTKQHNTHIPG